MRSSLRPVLLAAVAVLAVVATVLGATVPATATPKSGTTRTSARGISMSGVLGMDVSSHQGHVDWWMWRNHGMRFAYVKATEGSTYRNPYFASQYAGSASVGMLRGAYHFANPAGASGAEQARYFVANGGQWAPDGRTLPGVLDVEYNPSGPACYERTPEQIVAWIRAFVTEYQRLTGRAAIIYTNRDWWQRCTGNSTAFRTSNRLWVARYGPAVGVLPGQWAAFTFWQYSDSPIDQNRFNGTFPQLLQLATGAPRG